MNVFEFLGLAPEHRKLSNKVTQFVKHWDEVTDGNKRGKTFAVQVKRDGVCALTVVRDDGQVGIFSRVGKQFTNTEMLIARIMDQDLPTGVYMGEMLVPKETASLEVLSGCVNPNRVNPLSHENSLMPDQLQMHFFDYVQLGSFIAGTSPTAFVGRFDHLAHTVENTAHIEVLPYNLYKTEESIDNALEFCVSGGEEGIVIRDANADWLAGHKGFRVMKKVRGVDYDLLCVGYEEGAGKYKGKVANLLFKWKGGETIKCMLGRGWTHDMAEEMFVNIHMESGSMPMGKIFQVYALEESSKGKLRLAKVGEERHDKTVADII